MTGAVAAVERERYPLSASLGLFTFATLVFAWAFAAFLRIQESSDLTTHLEYTRQLHSLSDIRSPHFLFQLLVKAGYLLGLRYETAAVWLLGLCFGGMAFLIGQEVYRRDLVSSPLLAFGLVMAVLLASHIFLFTFQSNIYRGYFVPTVYHNPTQQLNKLFALWIYFIYARQILSGERAAWWSIPLLAVLCVLSAIAKPSFLIAFLPAAALYAGFDLLRRRWRQALLCLLGIGIPSALTLLWQAKLTAATSEGVAIALKPFVIFHAGETLYKLPLSLGFALVVAVGAWWTRASDVRLRFVWTFTAVALLVALFVVELGFRMMHGNFAWTAQTGVFILYVESLLFLLAQPLRPWIRAAWGLFGVHVICGIYWFSYVFRSDWNKIW
jgi:hypothetical protein